LDKHMYSASIDESKLDALFAPLNQSNQPGAAIGISLHGRPEYRKAFGLATIELPLTLTPSTRLRIGSSTKQFTCFAYLLLCEDGVARIDDPIGKYVPELAAGREATMRQLMGNISGLRDAYDVFSQFNCEYDSFGHTALSVDSTDILEMYRQIDDMNFEPGATWMYNNGGWLLLSIAIERISGLSLEEFFRTRVFGPIGMHNTLLSRADSGFVPNSGSQHAVGPGNSFAKMYWGLDNFLGAGAMISTVDDLLLWLRHLDSPRVGTRAICQLMATPLTLRNDRSTHYGLGLIVDSYRGVRTIFHAGGLPGGTAMVLKAPDLALDIAVLVNRHDYSAPGLAYQIIDACVPALEQPQTQLSGPRFTGLFKSAHGDFVIDLHEQDGRQMVSVNGWDAPAEQMDDRTFSLDYFRWSTPTRLVTVIGNNEHPSSIDFVHFGEHIELYRLDVAPAVHVEEIAGTYRALPIGVVAVISEGEDGPRLRTSGPYGHASYVLESLSANIWRAKQKRGRFSYLGGVLTFNNERTIFWYSNGSTHMLPFTREPSQRA
jgi:D-aminopeptidase